MGAINVQFPEGLEKKIDEYIERSGEFVNRSELVRDAVRRRIEDGTQEDEE